MDTPPLVPFGGDWEPYEDAIYEIYLDTLVRNPVSFGGLIVKCQYRPEGPDEAARTPDLRRCERIGWVAWLIRNADLPTVRWWKNRRGRNIRIVIWIESEQFAVVLEERPGYYLLKTAYWVKPFRSADFLREYIAFEKNPW